MRATVEWVNGVEFSAQADSKHPITMDGPAESGGKNAGSRPMELILMGLGGCASFDVVTILAKSRQKVTNCVANLSATRADGVPAVFESIHLQFVVTGEDLDPIKVERAVHLSADKYCSASIMLGKAGVKISHSFEIRDS